MKFSVALTSLSLVCGSVSAVFTPTRISFDSLVGKHSEADSESLLKALQDVGMISITGIPSFNKKETLESLVPCVEEPDVALEFTFDDGTFRRTIATHSLTTHGAQEMHLPKHVDSCMTFEQASGRFRDTVADVTEAFSMHLSDVLGLTGDEKLLVDSNNHDKTYSFLDIVDKGEHLEHFHSYERLQVPTEGEDTIDWHIDQGLVLLFTPGQTNGVPTEGFYIQLADGSTELVHFTQEDELVLFLGDGINQYVNPSIQTAPLRALPHALRVPQTQVNKPRVWYGRMVLPPATALHPTIAGRTTFGDIRSGMITNGDKVSMSLGCSSTTMRARELQEDCDNTSSAYCWHRCMAYKDYGVSPESCASQGLDLGCTNAEGFLWPGLDDPDFYINCVDLDTAVNYTYPDTGGDDDDGGHDHGHNSTGGNSTDGHGGHNHTDGGGGGGHDDHNSTDGDGGGHGGHNHTDGNGGGHDGHNSTDGNGGHGGHNHTDGDGGHDGHNSTDGGGHGGHNMTDGGGGHGGHNMTDGGGGHGGHNSTDGDGGHGGHNMTDGDGGHGGHNSTDEDGGHGGHNMTDGDGGHEGHNSTDGDGGHGGHNMTDGDGGHNHTDDMDCFSGINTVVVENKGMVAMKDLVIGDMVSIGGNKFSELYSFGHYHPTANTEYLQIQISGSKQPLEISKAHMVFVVADSVRKAVPASMISVGDAVLLSAGGVATVTKTSVVHRGGAFAPFTKTGTIAVSGVIASSYISLQGGTDVFMIGHLKTPFSLHWLAQASQAPHRIICELSPSYCSEEVYDENGVSTWASAQLGVAKWLLSQNACVVGIAFFFVVAACLAVMGLEMMLAYPLVLATSVLTLLSFRKAVWCKNGMPN